MSFFGGQSGGDISLLVIYYIQKGRAEVSISSRLKKLHNLLAWIPGTPVFGFILLLAAVLTVFLDAEVQGGLFFIAVICLELLLCRDTSVTLLPFLLCCVFLCNCYNSFNVFIVYLPLAFPAVICLISHFMVYRRAFSVGKSFPSLCAVAAAVTLGGLGTISFSDYFAPTAVFYTLGLGFGMTFIYLLLRSRFAPPDETEASQDGLFILGKHISFGQPTKDKLCFRLAFDMYLMGLFTAACVADVYFKSLDSLIAVPGLVDFQASNNFSTFLMFALPFPFYFTMNTMKKRCGDTAFLPSDLHLIPAAVMYLAIVLTNSRGGLVFGTVEVLVCFVFTVYIRGGKRRIFYYASAFFALLCTIFGGKLLLDYYRENINSGIMNATEARGGLILRALEDFKRNIIFGSGLGYKGNSDLYNPVKGAMNWYHVYPAQIVGSFGLCGIAAFGYMILTRLRLFLSRPNIWKLTLGLSYIGIFLMSLVNPGEFCPIPYEMLTVLLFIYLEFEEERETVSEQC